MKDSIRKMLFPGNFHLNFQVKSVLCTHFYRDAFDWIMLYKLSRQCEIESLSIKTKQFIHLRMALECMLKALLICLSKRSEKPEDAYSAAKKCSHNIEKLVNGCNARASGRYRICTKAMMERFRKVDSLGIGIRYDLEMKTAYKMQTPVEIFTESGPISDVLTNYKFHNEIWDDILFIRATFDRASEKRLGKHKSHVMARLSEIENYIRKITLRKTVGGV